MVLYASANLLDITHIYTLLPTIFQSMPTIIDQKYDFYCEVLPM